MTANLWLWAATGWFWNNLVLDIWPVWVGAVCVVGYLIYNPIRTAGEKINVEHCKDACPVCKDLVTKFNRLIDERLTLHNLVPPQPHGEGAGENTKEP